MSDEQQSEVIAAQREAFIKYLEETSKLVSTWPEWKQALLGPIEKWTETSGEPQVNACSAAKT